MAASFATARNHSICGYCCHHLILCKSVHVKYFVNLTVNRSGLCVDAILYIIRWLYYDADCHCNVIELEIKFHLI